jgi:hypothetical protein
LLFDSKPSAGLRIMAWGPFVGSAALAAIAIHAAYEHPAFTLPLIALAAVFWIPGYISRRRLKKLLLSGKVDQMLDVYGTALDRVRHRDTMVPIITATALAANGLVVRARNALERAHRGPAWEAALEHRLFVETLVDAFEGERPAALAKAEQLSGLPLPPLGPMVLGRVTTLRRATSALARAFARETRSGDARFLERAAADNPLVHWALSYAAAIAWIDEGDASRAWSLIVDAPEWPADSAFAAFHNELAERCQKSDPDPS